MSNFLSNIVLYFSCYVYRFTLWSMVLGMIAAVHAQTSVVTSMRPLGFIAAAVADGVVPVEVIMPDGVSPHDYALRPTDALRLKKADVMVWVGPELETFLSRPASSLLAGHRITLASLPNIFPLLQKNIKKIYENQENYSLEGKSRGYYHGRYNMHVWLSPIIAEYAAEAIHSRLVKLIPEKKQLLDNNLRVFKGALKKNNKIIAKMLAPVRLKGYYVFHDAYGYFEKYYGLKPLGYFTANPEIQPGAQVLHSIRTQLVKQKVTCIFAEPQFKPAIIDTITHGTSVHIGSLDPLGTGIALNKESYTRFLLQLSSHYLSCLEKTHEDNH